MKLYLNEVNLKLYRSRTKEIRLGLGKNKNSQIAGLHRSSISKIFGSLLQAQGPSVKLTTLSSIFGTIKSLISNL
ncbi:Elongation factor 2 [Gossypium arboreum]|uniref:Elongation factor 2 n=1 Tax=Gossypium arboreum TaxID=29729 RepID=A0A0B0MZM8_GOSAR|nr:Elongation factor 2 [Gossypium arboreum]